VRSPSRGRVRTKLDERVGRLRLSKVASPILGWVIACWVLSAVLATVLLPPSMPDFVRVDEYANLDRYFAPTWFRVIIALVGSVLAGATVALIMLLENVVRIPKTRQLILKEMGPVVVSGFPALALFADHEWAAATSALVLFAGLEITLHVTSVRYAMGNALVAGVAASCWFPLVLNQFFTDDDTPTWLWASLFAFAASFAAFGSFYAVARAAGTRTRAVHFLFNDQRSAPTLIGVVAIAWLLMALRMTIGRNLMVGRNSADATDADLWQPFARSPDSWVHAAVVAFLLCFIVLRRQPGLLKTGERRVITTLAITASIDLVLWVVVVVIKMFVAVPTGTMSLPDGFLKFTTPIQLLVIVIMGIAACLPRFRGTVGRWVALISAAYLIPALLGQVLDQCGSMPNRAFFWCTPVLMPKRAFWCTPVQVALLLLTVATVLGGWKVMHRGLPVRPSVIVRLAVVPLIALHAGWLLPAAWEGATRWVLVAGVVLALVLFMPKVAEDPSRHALNVLTASAAQLLTLALFAVALPSLLKDETFVIAGVLWLAFPVAAELIIDQRPQPKTSWLTGDAEPVGSDGPEIFSRRSALPD
jgi:hypothetical protein